MGETKMSWKASFPGNDQGRYGEIRVFEDSSHRVGCEKVHAARVGHGVFIYSSWYQARLKYSASGMTKRAFSKLCKWSTSVKQYSNFSVWPDDCNIEGVLWEMGETKMSWKASFPGNDQGRYGEIGVIEDSSHRVGCEKVSVGHGVFIHSSWYQARLKYFVSGWLNEL